MPSLLASTSLAVKRDRAALAASPSPRPSLGWKRSMCRRLASRRRAPSARPSRRASRPGRERKASRSRQSGHRSSRSLGPDAPVARRSLLVQAEAGVALRRVARSCSPKITSPGVRAECRWTTSRSASRRSRSRSMLMIGVMPLPALMNSSRVGQRVGQHEVPSTPPRRTIVPGCAWRDEVRRDHALVDELGRDAMQPVGAPGVRGQRVGAPVADAVDHDADAQVLAGLVAGPLPAGLDQDGHRVVGLALHALDAPAELARGPQRVDQLEVVVGQQRREEGAHRAQRTPLQRRDPGSGAALSHRLSRRVPGKARGP